MKQLRIGTVTYCASYVSVSSSSHVTQTGILPADCAVWLLASDAPVDVARFAGYAGA